MNYLPISILKDTINFDYKSIVILKGQQRKNIIYVFENSSIQKQERDNFLIISTLVMLIELK